MLGEDGPVAEASHEGGVPIGDELGGELHVDGLAEADDHHDAVVGDSRRRSGSTERST